MDFTPLIDAPSKEAANSSGLGQHSPRRSATGHSGANLNTGNLAGKYSVSAGGQPLHDLTGGEHTHSNYRGMNYLSGGGPADHGVASPEGGKPSTAEAGANNSYGLLGILNVVRMQDPDLNALALGTDLTTLGLDLESVDSLFSTVSSVFTETQPPKDAMEYFLPACYYANQAMLKHRLPHQAAFFRRFTTETLLYIFYTMCSDVFQGYAAVELYTRGWFYHTEYQKWFTTEAAQRQAQAEDLQGLKLQADEWVYFEPAVWRKRCCKGTIDVAKFLRGEMLKSWVSAAYHAATHSGVTSSGNSSITSNTGSGSNMNSNHSGSSSATAGPSVTPNSVEGGNGPTGGPTTNAAAGAQQNRLSKRQNGSAASSSGSAAPTGTTAPSSLPSHIPEQFLPHQQQLQSGVRDPLGTSVPSSAAVSDLSNGGSGVTNAPQGVAVGGSQRGLGAGSAFEFN